MPKRSLQLSFSGSMQSKKKKKKLEAVRPSKKSVTLYQSTQNCINIDQLEKDVHGPWYISLKGWLRPFCPITSCYYYHFIYKSKKLIHHTSWKCFHRFIRVPELHFLRIWVLQVGQFSLLTMHQVTAATKSTVLKVYKYYGQNSHIFRYK